jgi:hypothetical protein
VANEMRRDNTGLYNNDNFAVLLDTFHDRRNGVIFHTNALGGLFDAQVTDETHFNRDWNTVWDVKTDRTDEGWTLEMKIPFKSLRYKAGEAQVWGINFRRIVRSKNEFTHLTPIPASYSTRGLLKVSSAATIVGLNIAGRSKNLEVKPYVRGDVTSDLALEPVIENELGGDAGLDVKYGLTRGVTFDFTYNTDFAQVEVDEQQVNLTRFNLFFPEKREFFLEGQDIFRFGTEGIIGSSPPKYTPLIFFSRRIGLEDGQVVPISVGGRLTGRIGRQSIGLLSIQTEDFAPAGALATNFSVIRLKRDVFERSNIGVMLTRRSPQLGAEGTNLVYGVDADLALQRDLRINAYYARSDTAGTRGRDTSYRVRLDYNADLFGVQLENMAAEENFDPQMGFLPRRDFRRTFGQLRLSRRPRNWPSVRKLNWIAAFDYITDHAGKLETRVEDLGFLINMERGDEFDIGYVRSLEFLPEEFEIAEGIVLPVDRYEFQTFRYRWKLAPQNRISGDLSYEWGTFFNGTRARAGYRGRIEIVPQLSVEPGLEFNWVDLVQGYFTTRLVTARVNYTLSPRIYMSALTQYNSSNNSFSTNVRFRWEYQPGSDLFVVYSDGRDMSLPGAPQLIHRTFVIKATRLFRF